MFNILLRFLHIQLQNVGYILLEFLTVYNPSSFDASTWSSKREFVEFSAYGLNLSRFVEKHNVGAGLCPLCECLKSEDLLKDAI